MTMAICKWHPQIAYDDELRECPVCELEYKIKKLENENEELKKELESEGHRKGV